MPYPAAYLPEEKQLLSAVFNRFPDVEASFHACENIYPQFRIEGLREKMTAAPRRIWRDLGIPEESCETLADHAGAMHMLALRHPVKGHNADRIAEMIGVWGLPQAVEGEVPHEAIGAGQRQELDRLMARLAFDHYVDRPLRERWNMLAEGKFKESRWVHDLDFIATAARAVDYRDAFPALTHKLDTIIWCCGEALQTPEGKGIFAAANRYERPVLVRRYG